MGKRASVYFDRDKLYFVGIDDVMMKQIADTYPSLDLPSELKKMCLWLSGSRGKGVKGTIGFIINWLNRSCPTKRSEVHCSLVEDDSILAKEYQAYLEDLWKGREHILEMNRIYGKMPH
jgi:hypothetical protein